MAIASVSDFDVPSFSRSTSPLESESKYLGLDREHIYVGTVDGP